MSSESETPMNYEHESLRALEALKAVWCDPRDPTAKWTIRDRDGNWFYTTHEVTSSSVGVLSLITLKKTLAGPGLAPLLILNKDQWSMAVAVENIREAVEERQQDRQLAKEDES